VQNASTTLPESLSGLVERVTFHNDENGWTVLKVKAKGHRELVSVVGSLASVSAGEWITAQGHWVQDRELADAVRARYRKATFAPFSHQTKRIILNTSVQNKVLNPEFWTAEKGLLRMAKHRIPSRMLVFGCFWRESRLGQHPCAGMANLFLKTTLPSQNPL
jgi:hypothetical protein